MSAASSRKKDTVRYLLAAAVTVAVTLPADASPFDRYRIGAYRAQNMSVVNKYNFNRNWIGSPLMNETDVTSNATGVRGSRMIFTNGIIYRMQNGGYPGRTTVIQGDLRRRYEQSGGLNGPLGFPIEDHKPTPGATGRYNQRFERGSIVWNPNNNQYVVLINP
ncbi:MAG: hypothetical protein JNG89_08285 [Planctomycetaceae bacterium]|nr:hypothetical protein [Planctomycetaceae bacterium]